MKTTPITLHDEFPRISWFLAAFLLVAGNLSVRTGALWGQQPPASPVRYTKAQGHVLQGLVQLPGTVESPTISVIAGEVDALVVNFPVQEGDAVKKGQVLVQLRTENLELQLQASQAELKEAEARRKLAERNLERAQELFDSEVFSRQEFDQSLYEFNAWEGRIERLRAEIERIQDDIRQCTIVAPFDGVVIAERTQVGQWLGQGDPVVDLMSVDNLQVAVDVPERYLLKLKVGRRVTVEFPALDGRRTAGVVRRVIPRADPQARTFPVKLAFPRGGGQLVAGMLAQVSFPAGEPQQATIVPKDAIVNQGAQRLVFVINDDSTVNPVPVELGAGMGVWIEARGPIRPGQRVVTRGNERLRPGQRVQAEPIEYALP